MIRKLQLPLSSSSKKLLASTSIKARFSRYRTPTPAALSSTNNMPDCDMTASSVLTSQYEENVLIFQNSFQDNLSLYAYSIDAGSTCGGMSIMDEDSLYHDHVVKPEDPSMDVSIPTTVCLDDSSRNHEHMGADTTTDDDSSCMYEEDCEEGDPLQEEEEVDRQDRRDNLVIARSSLADTRVRNSMGSKSFWNSFRNSISRSKKQNMIKKGGWTRMSFRTNKIQRNAQKEAAHTPPPSHDQLVSYDFRSERRASL